METRLEELPDVLTVPEVMRLLRLGRNTVYECCKTGEIPSIRLGRRLLIPRAALERMLTATRSRGTAG